MRKILLILLALFVLIFALLFIGRPAETENISWGITFSSKYAEDLGLDWKETYLAIIEDLGVKKIRIPAYWDLIEPAKDDFNFEDIDWQLEKARENNIEVIMVVGMKVPRWPECHIPQWAKDLDQNDQQEEILKMIEEVVLRYKDHLALNYWQIENEPFLDFGICPWYDKSFLQKEIDKVRLLDQETPIMITESGELSSWIPAAKIADIVGVTMYRQTWWHRAGGFYFKYPITPVHYYRKAELVRRIYDKDVICVEFQAEPWGPAPTYVISLEEQEKSMNPDIFIKNIEFAKRTGLEEIYFWGAEWWYWMKTVHDQPEIWDLSKNYFK